MWHYNRTRSLEQQRQTTGLQWQLTHGPWNVRNTGRLGLNHAIPLRLLIFVRLWIDIELLERCDTGNHRLSQRQTVDRHKESRMRRWWHRAAPILQLTHLKTHCGSQNFNVQIACDAIVLVKQGEWWLEKQELWECPMSHIVLWLLVCLLQVAAYNGQ